METRKESADVLPEEPFLFYQEPPDWRWLSFAEAAEAVGRWKTCLEDVEDGTRVGIAGSPSAASLIADIAVRASGLVAVPCADSGVEVSGAERVDSVLDLETYELRTSPVPPPLDSAVSRIRSQAAGGSSSGGCVVWKADAAPAIVRGASLEDAVERLGRDIGVPRERPLVVHGRNLGDEGERLVVEWAIHQAAAVVIAAPGTEMSMAHWVRPTLLHGSAADVGEWLRKGAAKRHGHFVLERRFRRLEAVVVLGGDIVDDESRGRWNEVGVRVVSAPTLWPAGEDRL